MNCETCQKYGVKSDEDLSGIEILNLLNLEERTGMVNWSTALFSSVLYCKFDKIVTMWVISCFSSFFESVPSRSEPTYKFSVIFDGPRPISLKRNFGRIFERAVVFIESYDHKVDLSIFSAVRPLFQLGHMPGASSLEELFAQNLDTVRFPLSNR